MKLTLLGYKVDCFGVINVAVQVNDKKEYIFPLSSWFDLEEFMQLLQFHPGKALNYLKKVQIKLH